MKISHIIAALAVFGSLVGFTQTAAATDRSTYTAYASQRGSTVNVPASRVSQLCGDWDGCTIRIGMYNWDGTRRTASRETLFYYDNYSRNWRASRSDLAGTNDNNYTQHAIQAWACYFTDGYYSNWYNHGDINANFGLMSWNQYNAACKLTIID